MDNLETQATLDTRHRTKNTTHKTKMMSNKDPTKIPEVNLGACEGQ